MRPIDRPLPPKTGLTACALICALLLAAAGIVSTQAGPSNDTPNQRAAQAAAGEWRTVSTPPVAGQRINALLVDRAGRLWVGTEERGLAVWDGTSWRALTTRDGLPDNRILTMFEDQQGRVWAATGTGLGYVTPAATLPLSMTVRRLSVTELPSLPILAFGQGADGTIYLGTGGGLSRWQEGKTPEPVEELAGQRVNALHTRRDGTLWAGTEQGLWQLAGGKWTAITAEGSPGAARIRGIAESPERMLYVWAGNNELWRSRGVVWERMELPAVLPADITAMGFAHGRLWVGTHAGVWANEAGIWQQYDASRLPGPAGVAFAPAPDGTLWIGTGGGLVEYQPERSAPTVEIVAINGIRPEEGAVTLARDRIERVEVAATDGHTPPDRLIINTRLDGVDDVPRVQRAGAITAYGDRRLEAGSTILHVWAQDEAFNRSVPAEVTVITPDLVYLPAGLALRSEVAYPILAAAALLLVTGMIIFAAIEVRRRAAARAAAAEAARVQAVVAEGFNPYERDAVKGGAIDALLPDEPVREVVQALQDGNVLLLGARGMGKTSTLRRTAGALRSKRNADLVSIPAYLDLSSTPPDSLLHDLMDRAAAAAEPLMVGEQPRLQWHETASTAYGAREFHADLQLLLASLRPAAAPHQLRFVLLLDEAQVLDGCPPSASNNVRGLLVGTMGGQLRAVLAAEHSPQALGDLEHLFRRLDMRPLSDAAARDLLVNSVRHLYEWAPGAVDLVVREAAGRPDRLLEIAAASVRRTLAAGRIDITAADAASAVVSAATTEGAVAAAAAGAAATAAPDER